MRELEATWEAFVDLLDEYRRRKNHLKTINRHAVENQLRTAERTMQFAEPAVRPLHEKNVEILRRRLQTYDDIERSVKGVEAQLQVIENFSAWSTTRWSRCRRPNISFRWISIPCFRPLK